MKIIPIIIIFSLILGGVFLFKKEKIVVDEEVLNNPDFKKATFAGGCFWCMEPPFEKLNGVEAVVSGYSGGDLENPTYKQVSAGETTHLESIQIIYDPAKISYAELVEVFWKQVDPTDSQGQFVDRGYQYTSSIFYNDKEEKEIAQKSKENLEKSGKYDKPIVTNITPFKSFYLAEDYHQDYYSKNPVRYKYYRGGSGRDQYLESVWGDEKEDILENTFEKPSDAELREMLTPLQYKVTQQDGTERSFNNEYWDNHEEGIYVDIVSGEALFSSIDKFDSGTGWPSFTKTIDANNVVEKEDNTLFTTRTEVRSKKADSHLGHIFLDGPGPTKVRYCMNSAALRFVPKENLEKEGHAEYLDLFE